MIKNFSKIFLRKYKFPNPYRYTLPLCQYTQYYSFCTNKNNLKEALNEGKNEINNVLKQIRFEDGKNLMDSGQVIDVKVEEGGKVNIRLKLDQNYRKIKSLIQTNLITIPWIKDLQINLASKDQEVSFVKKGGLKDVKKIIAVSSCKGGVGKSTIAINLACALMKLHKKVGIFDADIYGPSLPTLIAKENAILEAHQDRPKEIIPIEYEGLKAMSYGFASRGKRAVMRGPMVSSIVTQLVYATDWGDLDYLIVDMPPGTGDVQITLCQELKFDAAVIVTTPQRLSFVDVVKGIEMFDDLKVPTVSVVENMAYFQCDKCDHVHTPFGPGYMNMLKKQFGIKRSIAIPLYGDISKYSDLGAPTVLALPEEHTISKIYIDLAKSVDSEVASLSAKNEPPHVRYDTAKQMVIIRTPDGKEKAIKAFELRKKCGCAACIDEFTGKKLLKEDNIPSDVFPHKIEPKGNYAVAIIWSDGHRSSIYPYERLLSPEITEYKKGN